MVVEIKPGDVYSAEVEVKAPTISDLTLEGPKIPEGKVVLIKAFYIMDRSTAGKKVRLGYDRGGTKIWVKREDLADTVYGMETTAQLYLVEGEKPIGMIESPTIDDICILVVRGEYVC